jgi:glycosyltransferase involved in cell wall biosynthesis
MIVAPEEEEIGGVQNVIGNLTRYLRSQGHDILFFHASGNTLMKMSTNRQGCATFDSNLQLPFGERSRIVSLLLFLIRFPIGLIQLIRIIRKNKIQIINVHYPTEAACYFALCRRILSIRLVTSVHGADLFPAGRPKTKYSGAIRLLLGESDRIVAPSESFRNDVAALFPSFDGRIVSIHNGVNFDEMASPNGDIDVDSLGQYILCVAMHNEKKGIDVLLQAFSLMQKVAPLLTLVLVGDGHLRSDLETLAKTLEISSKVKFLGRKGRPEVAKLILHCEIFVLPSRAEPFGIVLIEAMACRKPVVATMVGGIPEIVENGKNGILVEPDNPKALAEALIAMLQDQDLRSSLATNGYFTVQRSFSSEATGSAYETLFADIYS